MLRVRRADPTWRIVSRRSFLRNPPIGLGGLALASSHGLAAEASDDRWRGVITKPHFPIKAKRIIHLCMAGGPSQFESFDWKPD